MRVKRFFSMILAYVLVFSLSIPVSAAELVGAASIETQNSISVSGNDAVEVTVSEGDSKEDGNKAIAVELPVYEEGNVFDEAIPCDFGTKYYGSITDEEPSVCYELTLNESGKITIIATAEMKYIVYTIYDCNGNSMWSEAIRWNSVTGVSTFEYSIDLVQGTYYFVASQHPDKLVYGCEGDYCTTISYESAEESFRETEAGENNALKTASLITIGESYKGQIAYNDGADFYSFNLPSSGNWTFTLSGKMNQVNYYIYDANFNEIKSDTFWCDNVTQTIFQSINMELVSGTYYLGIKTRYNYTGNYSFDLKHVSAEESFKETVNEKNDSMETASSIQTGVTYKGQIANNDARDFYKFTLNHTAEVEINAESYMYRVTYYIYDANANKKWSCAPGANATTGKSNITELIQLEPGTYYFVVEQYNTNLGNYSFNVSEHSHKYVTTVTKATTSSNGKVVVACECGKLKSEKILYAASNIKLSKTTYTYDGKAKKPSVVVKDSKGKKISASNYTVTYAKGRKDVGKYKVTIKFKGNYKGTVTQTFTITPKKTSITKLTGSKKGFTVKWNKVSKQATGYEVQYSPSSGFYYSNKTKKVTSAGKTSLKITGCKSKYTYYVRVRAYKTVKGKKYYSDWSKAKKVKTK